MADTLAKTGTRLTIKENIGPSRAHINAHITSHMYKTWNDRWIQTKGLRQTKLFIQNVGNRGRAKKARDLNRNDMGILVRNLTGHAFIRRHNYIVGSVIPEVNTETLQMTFWLI